MTKNMPPKILALAPQGIEGNRYRRGGVPGVGAGHPGSAAAMISEMPAPFERLEQMDTRPVWDAVSGLAIY